MIRKRAVLLGYVTAPDLQAAEAAAAEQFELRMRIIERLNRGCEPSWRPAPSRIDTS